VGRCECAWALEPIRKRSQTWRARAATVVQWRPSRCKTDVDYAVRKSRGQRAKSGVEVGRVATAASRRQTASQRCGGMRGWAALSSHRTSDVPVSGCASGERMHVGCSGAGVCGNSSGRSGRAVRSMAWSRSRVSRRKTDRAAGRRETQDDTSGARVWMVDGWGFSLGLGNRITRDYLTRWRRDRSVPNVMLRLVRVLCWACGGLLESALMVMSRWPLFSRGCLIVLTAIDRRICHYHLPPPSHVAPIHTRCTAKTWSTFRSQASGPGECRARPAPPAATLTRANETPLRYPATCTHADGHGAVLAVCAAGFTCRRLLALQLRCRAGLIIIALTCNCHELPTSSVRQAELGHPNSARRASFSATVIGHSQHRHATVALALTRMPVQAGPSESASRKLLYSLRAGLLKPVDSLVSAWKGRRASATLSFAGL
jgi:hypothetical protein